MSDLSYTQYLLKKQQILMAGEPELPTDFEVIVIGTGLEESIIAAALARNGHNVLHIDIHDYYGESWAAFNFSGIQDWISNVNKKQEKVEESKLQELLEQGEILHFPQDDNSITDVKQEWYVPTEDSEEADKGWTKSKVLEKERMFNIDLNPRLLYSRGSMVDLLIQSNISRYTEFKSVSRVLTRLSNGNLEHVPSSRADVFATKHVSVVEKRILMKFLTFCLNYQECPDVYQAFKDKPYLDFLRNQKLTDNLIHFVIHSIAMIGSNASTLEGLQATQKFLSSLGRFGNTPFLYSSFGSGELPQAFCRLCAVFGGTYYLGHSIDALITDQSNIVKGIITNHGQLRINCQKIVMRGQLCPSSLTLHQDLVDPTTIHRKICLNSDSILSSEKEQLTFASLPSSSSASDDKSYTFCTEVGHGAAVCPKSMYCLHLTKQNPAQPFDDLVKTEHKIWSLEYNIVTETLKSDNDNMFLTSGPHFELDYDLTIENAKKIYQSMFPEEPFLPRAPDPEEIILDDPEVPSDEIKNESNE